MASQSPTAAPSERLSTYARLWQLETWLRSMVYVELRACYGDDWKSHLQGASEKSYDQDRELSHMPTPEHLPTSYMQLGGILKTISCEWRLFEQFLPLKQIWDAKIVEVKQIRHRIAHFRLGHRRDANRVEQLLGDIDQGFWHFCTSYNSRNPVLPPARDPVMAHFLHLDPFPWRETQSGQWARFGTADPNLLVSVSIDISCRPWLESPSVEGAAGSAGYLYDATLGTRDLRSFDYSYFLATTKHVHSSLCHIHLDDLCGALRITVPAILGAKMVSDIIDCFVKAAEQSLRPAHQSLTSDGVGGYAGYETKIDLFAKKKPEYILGPSNPLSFLDPDVPCSFFGVD